jgi:DNA-binding transcriptional ArsR family regulator
METKHSVEIPGVEFLVNERGEKRAVLIDLRKHRALWEDLYDAYLVHARRREPRESLAQVKRLLRRSAKRRTRA